MRSSRYSLWAIVGGILFGALAANAQTAQAQTAPALSGQVTSAQEATMEGVLVNLKREGSTITTTVVTNEQGRYAFPADRVQPGKYTVSIRAVGYILDGPKSVEIPAAGNATADLKLNRARNIHLQLSNAEWMASLPGTDRDKQFLTGCTGCHTLQRIFSAQHDVDEWIQVFNRMGRYFPGSTPSQPQLLVSGGERSERPRVDPKIAQAAAQFLVDVSLTNPEAKEYDFKSLPRPKGRATRVIITEYDLPRKNAYPHDVVVDADGQAWYSDFGSQVMGVLDPKTGKVIDYDIPVVRPEQPKGTLDLQLDRDGNLWIAMMYQSAIAKMDRQTRKLTVYPFPKEWLGFTTQASMVAPRFSHVDGKVWTNNQETREYYRLDLATGKFENTGKAIDKNGRQISAYGIPTDHDNNLYLLEFGGTSIGRRDAKTLDVEIWRTPFPNSRPRRGGVDHLNRLWFAEYHGGIAMFDPKTNTIKEWMTSTKWDNPYAVMPTRSGEAWTGSMHTDLVTRLFTESGDMVQYLLPRTTNIRRVFVEETGPRPVLWVGSNHGASIVKVEPLD
ncbi:MAG TPA: carboxypeptidase regulatory-like domain-containing protein [Xanthobacteraceae bacterium]|nr:carboxypeptidase regulatory-like domain-containing protein [Xanthobacteraceae bacterium]